jgi:hypothetical protein
MAHRSRISASTTPKRAYDERSQHCIPSSLRPISELLDLAFDRHEIQCPYCCQPTQHFWPGGFVLFGELECMCCGELFLMVQNQCWPETNRLRRYQDSILAPSCP